MRFCARPNKVIYSKKRNNQTESEEVQREETHPRKCRTQVGTQKKILQVNKNFQIDIFKYFMSEGFHKSRSTNCLKKLKCLISDTYSLGGGQVLKILEVKIYRNQLIICWARQFLLVRLHCFR